MGSARTGFPFDDGNFAFCGLHVCGLRSNLFSLLFCFSFFLRKLLFKKFFSVPLFPGLVNNSGARVNLFLSRNQNERFGFDDAANRWGNPGRSGKVAPSKYKHEFFVYKSSIATDDYFLLYISRGNKKVK